MSLRSYRGLVASLTIFGSLAAGCTAGGARNVSGKVEVLGQSTSAFMARSQTVSYVNGVYGPSCSGHSNGDPWSAGVNGQTSFPNPAIAVEAGNSSCELSVTEVVSNGEAYLGDHPITLDLSYAGASAAYKNDPSNPIGFFANAKIDSLAFQTDFTISLLVSNRPMDASDSQQAALASDTGTVSADDVLPPDYGIDLTSITTQTDSNGIIVNAGGYAQLSANDVPGPYGAIIEGELTSDATLEEIESAFNAGSPFNVGDLTNLQIPVSQFDLVGEDVSSGPAVRTVILLNRQAGVDSFQLVVLRFYNHNTG
jgi:hypothetical protein